MKKDRITATTKPAESLKTDLLVFLALEIKNKPPICPKEVASEVKQAYELGDFKGEEGQELIFYPGAKKKTGAKRILVLGLGGIAREKDGYQALDRLREAGGKLAKAAESVKAKDMVICLPEAKLLSPAFSDLGLVAEPLCEGVVLGDYRFVKYKETTKKKTDYPGLTSLRFACMEGLLAVRQGIRHGCNAAFAACAARDMANEPGNGWTSADFAAWAKVLARDTGLTYRCIEKKEMAQLGMGGILAVNQGSAVPPRMIILEYRPESAKETILLVGKGLTFDSGGISIKPAENMQDMKYDMCGGAAVLTAMQVVAEEKPEVAVVAIVPATDNMSGSNAVHPGDIIRHFNGVTSEVINTDAEGRLILADALSYGIKTYSPSCVVDVATLTGAVIIGLGHHYTGLISNHDLLSQRLLEAADRAGEPVWRLPLNKHFKKQIESKVADIKNTGGRPGGAITAAAYLSSFVGETPWAHLDIAGTAWDFTEKDYIPKGPSGIAVRTFINLIRLWKPGKFKPVKPKAK